MYHLLMLLHGHCMCSIAFFAVILDYTLPVSVDSPLQQQIVKSTCHDMLTVV